MAEAFKKNQTLTNIDLSWNKIGYSGMKSISDSLEINQVFGKETVNSSIHSYRRLISVYLVFSALNGTKENYTVFGGSRVHGQLMASVVHPDSRRFSCSD